MKSKMLTLVMLLLCFKITTSTITRKAFSESDITKLEKVEGKCSICLSPLFSLKDNIVILNCHPTHRFHETCLHTWCLENSEETASCPTCRKEVVKSPMFNEIKRQSESKELESRHYLRIIRSLQAQLNHRTLKRIPTPYTPNTPNLNSEDVFGTESE